MDGIDFQNFQFNRLPFLHRIPWLLSIRRAKLRPRHEPFDVAAEVHDDPLVHQPHDAAPQLGADGVRLPDPQPRIFLRLLQAQRDPLVLGVDVENQNVDLVALLHDLRRMLDALGPRHVGDVNQPVDTRLDFDECAEGREVADLATQPRADGILLRQRHPRILLGLFHPERDLLFSFVHLQDNRLDRLADGYQFRRVAHVARPAHLGDVHQPLDAGLEFDKGAVVRDRHNLALHARSNRILRGDVLPGIGLELFQTERDALALPVDVEDLYFELLADLHHLGRMRHAPVAHIGDVQQAVHAAQVDEGAEIGDVLDDALPHLADLELLHQDLALGLALSLEQHAPAHHDVAAPLVQLDDLELEGLPEELVDVGHAAQRDLAARQERIHPHQVHDHAALDLLHERALRR